jgi:transposase-like protein
MTDARAFRGFRFPAGIVLRAVRWYLQFPISYRDLTCMLADRGVEVDHVSLYRWVQRFAPELEKRVRRHLRPCRGSWHVDETTARRALAGAEAMAMAMLAKGQVRAVPTNDLPAQRAFVQQVFGLAA